MASPKKLPQARTQGWFGWFQRTSLAGLEVAVFCRETTGPPLGYCRLQLKASKEPPTFELWVRACLQLINWSSR